MKTTVIHHSADYDGIFCREIARKFLPDTELIGWDFGQPTIAFPCEGWVYILDLPPECMTFPPCNSQDEKMECYNRMVWIDHHKSSIEKWPDFIPGYRIDGVAACRLAWQWFQLHRDFPDMPEVVGLPDKLAFVDRQVSEPYAVRLAGEYDIWDKRDPDAELFQCGLRSRELKPDDWHRMLFHTFADENPFAGIIGELLKAGKSVQYAKTHENESIIKSAGFDLEFEGLHFIACNHARCNSFLFTAGLKPEHDACMGFSWRGGKWTVSLYHAPGHERHDLSLIAVKHGGGGHRGACGFTCATLPFPLT